MLKELGQKISDRFKRYMPDAFVFALVLTLVIGLSAVVGVGASVNEVLQAWYKGFWGLLEFGMQMTLLIVTGYSIALSPLVDRYLNLLGARIYRPTQVYLIVILFGLIASLISWGWVVIAAVLGRALAKKVAGVHYPFLIACSYFSNNIWSTGLSSSIPLLLNTPNNYLIKAGILEDTLSTTTTLGSWLNLSMICLYFVLAPLLMWLLRPRNSHGESLQELLTDEHKNDRFSTLPVPTKSTFSDRMNHSKLLIALICIAGFWVVGTHFWTQGFDLNLNVMIFIFLLLGMALHQTPLGYGHAMQKASSNVSAILFQFPFYAGIMGIMIHTGLATNLSNLLADMASINTLPSCAFIIGGMVNFAIPSGGGEFAVIGPSIIEATQLLGNQLSLNEQEELLSRTLLALTYGESLTNLLQPFFILMVLPIMAAGTRIQARDVMGYLVIPFGIFFCLQLLLINFMPL